MKKKIPPARYVAIFLLLEIGLHILFPIRMIFFLPENLLGLIPILAGMVLNLYANGQFRRQGTTTHPFENPDKLVISGALRWSRNPMYLGFVLMLTGIAILLGSLSPFLTPVGLFLALDKTVIPAEETTLEEIFGDEYRQYKNRVRRWL